jgi:hypothetical protein
VRDVNGEIVMKKTVVSRPYEEGSTLCNERVSLV